MKEWRMQLLKWMIETAVPLLNIFRATPEWHYSMAQQREFPEGTLGRDLAIFLDSLGLPLLPKYEVHDTLHVLLAYGTSPLEELKLQGFMLGNGSCTFAGKCLFALGVVIVPDHWSELKPEIQRGATVARIAGSDFNQLIREKTGDLRNRFGIRC